MTLTSHEGGTHVCTCQEQHRRGHCTEPGCPYAPAKPYADRPKRGEVLLACIYDDVDRLLNPNNEECWHCGGEGETYDCIDGCCVDAESGCPDCARPCIECRIAAGQRARAIREEVIKSDDVDIARAWIKEQGRLRADTTDDMILEQMAIAKAELEKTAQPTPSLGSNQDGTGGAA